MAPPFSLPISSQRRHAFPSPPQSPPPRPVLQPPAGCSTPRRQAATGRRCARSVVTSSLLHPRLLPSWTALPQLPADPPPYAQIPGSPRLIRPLPAREGTSRSSRCLLLLGWGTAAARGSRGPPTRVAPARCSGRSPPSNRHLRIFPTQSSGDGTVARSRWGL